MRHFEKLLRLFPSPNASRASTVLVRAVSAHEPPLLERPVNGPADVDEALRIFGDYSGETSLTASKDWWDLWQFNGDWLLLRRPSAYPVLAPNSTMPLACLWPIKKTCASILESMPTFFRRKKSRVARIS